MSLELPSLTRREALRRLAVSAATPLILGGCGLTGNSKKITIRFWNGFTGPDGARALSLVRAFNAANPNIEVRMQRIEWGTYYNKLFVAGIAGRAPEVFVLHTQSLRRFAGAGFVRPIDDLVARDFPVTDLNTNIWQAASLDGKHCGLPIDVHMLGLYYNRKLLREAGIAKPPTNREEFVAALKAITKGEGDNRVWGFALSNPSSTIFSLMRQFGGELFTPDESRCLLNTPANAAALQFWIDLIRTDKTIPAPETLDSWVAFRQGRVGMTANGIFMLPDLQKQKDLDFAGAPMPRIGEKPATWASSHTFCLKSGMDDERTDAAWRFCRFYSDNSLEWAAAGQVPARRSLRESKAFHEMPVQSAFAQQIPYLAYPPRLPFIFEFQTEFDYLVERTLRGTVTAAEGLKEAEANVNKIIARRAAEQAEVRGA
jgi:multiple sugar transport system substrate-binding protein